jgi:hypothetical protein
MKSWIALCGGAALMAAMLAGGNAAANAAPVSRVLDVAPVADRAPATDLSARRRAHRPVRHQRRAYRAPKQPSYYARPSYYRPGGMAPFFPFHHGYGMEPSW